MRVLLWVIAGTLLLALQAGLAPRCALGGVRPDWILAAVVFLAMHLPAWPATAGAWSLGLAADLLTLERPGLLATTYAATALLVAAWREYLFRRSALTQFVVTLAVGVPVRALWLVYQQATGVSVTYGVANALWEVVWGAVYTALFAPPLHYLLIRMGKPLGLRVPRYSHAGLHR